MKTHEYLATLGRVIFFLFFAISVFKVGELYGRHSEDKGIIEFFSEKKAYEWPTGQLPPPELQERVNEYNGVVLNVWLAQIGTALILIAQYLEDKKNHWFTKLKERFKNVRV